MGLDLLHHPEGLSTLIPKSSLASSESSVELVTAHDFDARFFRLLEQHGVYLNRSQIEAVRHGEGPLLTLAGAGSGKTSVLVCRTAYLLSVQNVDPRNILLITFTRKAADEMKHRIALLPGISRHTVRQITAGTFHSFFLRILRNQGYQQKLLTSEHYKQTIIKILLKELGLQDGYQPETLLSLFSYYKNRMVLPLDLPSFTPVEKEIKNIFLNYETWKQREQLLDFDDILVECLKLLERTPSLLKQIQDEFQFVMVDEFQDTNPIQYRLIQMVAQPRNNLYVVGDDDQTIFSFNSADLNFILNFPRQYPNAKQVTLGINYRSTTAIVGLGNEIIRHNIKRNQKVLQATKETDEPPFFVRPGTIDEEAEWVIQQIQEDMKRNGRTFRDYSILHRTVTSARAVMEQLVLQEVPFLSFSSGEIFYEQSFVKPVIDYLRISQEPKNEVAIEGILPSLYLNKEQTMSFIRNREQNAPTGFPLSHLLKLSNLKVYQRDNLKKRLQLIKELAEKRPIEAIQMIRGFYDKFLDTNDRQSLTMHKETLKEMLDELESSAKRFGSIRDFLNFIQHLIKTNQQMEELRKIPDLDAVSLMTIHKSKGLEFPCVFLIGMSEGILPHSSAMEADSMGDLINGKNGKEKVEEAIEEERRLAYVGVTRSKETLYISSPSFYRGKRAAVSRFIKDVYEQKEVQNPIAPEMSVNKKQKRVEPNFEQPPKVLSQGEPFVVNEDVLKWVCTNNTCMEKEMIVDYTQSSKRCSTCGFPMTKKMIRVTRQI